MRAGHTAAAATPVPTPAAPPATAAPPRRRRTPWLPGSSTMQRACPPIADRDTQVSPQVPARPRCHPQPSAVLALRVLAAAPGPVVVQPALGARGGGDRPVLRA